MSVLYFSGFACVECGDWEGYSSSRARSRSSLTASTTTTGGHACISWRSGYFLKRRMVDEATGGIAELLNFFSNESAVFGDIQLSWARANAARAELLHGDLEAAAGHLDQIPKAVMAASRGPVQNAVCRGAYAAFAVETARTTSAADGSIAVRAANACTLCGAI